MHLVRWDPFGFNRELDRWFADTWQTTGARSWLPRVDVIEREGNLVVRAEVPGIDAESLEVTVDGNDLVISGSRSFEREEDTGSYRRREIYEGRFTRTVVLPEGVDTDTVTASSKDGILEVTIAKSPEILPRKVEVAIEN